MDADTVQERFLKIIKSHSVISGLWPYQTGIWKYFSRVILILIGLSSIPPQIAHIIMFFSLDTIVFQCPFLAVAFGIVIKEIMYIIHQNKLRSLYDDIFKDWAVSRTAKEYAILESYYKRTNQFINFYAVNAVLCITLFLQVPIAPMLLDLIIPLNESRETVYMWPIYFCANQDKYYSLITANMVCVVLEIYLVYIACDTTYVLLVQHTCALLEIAGHRFKYAVPKTLAANQRNVAKAADEVYRKICYSIQEHQRAVNFVRDIQLVHEVYLLIATGLTMLCFSVTLFKVMSMEYSVDSLKLYSFLVIQITHLLVITFPGQMVINRNDEVHRATYESLWYNTSTKGQALYLLPLRKSEVLTICAAGNTVTMNFQTLLSVVKTAISYCMVLRSSLALTLGVPYKTQLIIHSTRSIAEIESVNAVNLSLQVGRGMITFSITLVNVTTVEISWSYFAYCVFIAGQLIHLFFLNITGQYIVDSNNQTFNQIYEGMWYKGSTKLQFLYMFVLQRCLITPKLTGGKIVDLNLMTFLQIIKVSFSYYGLLKTV